MTKKIAFGGVCLFLATLVASAFGEPTLGDVSKHQDQLDVGTDLRLMCVAAHPDDEDGATLAMYRKKYGYKTFDVLATRGEGGQNEIGPELYEKLAVLRTDEMSRAAAITGAELHFLNMPEFGFSKSKAETFEIWGYDKAFERMVRKIRELRPDVIITHHPPQGQHGHHQAIGQVLQDAFDKAADPKVCPEQIKEGLKPWQPARLYVRNFGGGTGVRIDFNELDPVRGLTYAEIAANALREHKTQGMGFFIDRFLTSRSTASYGLVKESKGGTQGGGSVDAPGGTLFEGLKDRVTAGDRAISTASLNELNTAKAVAHLKAARASDADAARANRLAAAIAELRVTAKTPDNEIVAGQQITISAEAIDFGTKEAGNVNFELRPKAWFPAKAPGPVNAKFSPEGFASAEFKLTIPNAAPTIPYDVHVFDDHYLEPELVIAATADIGGTPVTVEAPVRFDIAPAVSLDFLKGPYLMRVGGPDAADFAVLVTNHSPGAATANVTLSAANGLAVDAKPVTLSFAAEGEQKVLPVHVRANKGIKPGRYALKAASITGDVKHDAEETVNVVDVGVPKDKRVGVVESYDDTFMTTLERLGVPHEAVQASDFTPERLDRFTTIIVDIRTYLVRPDLIGNNQALLDYVKRGGTVIVMYHKTIEWKPNYAPYELVVGGGRVTVETAPIKLLHPDHPLFNVPNKIVPADWDNWVQERGLYFPNKWAAEYTPLISVGDPGETPSEGSCLVAKYGKGTYMYTALVWYRQLRAMNPGAIRVFANMLAL